MTPWITLTPASVARKALALASVLLATLATSAAPVAFDIPAQPAPSALDLFIKQSGQQVAYSITDLSKVNANAVVGQFEPEIALTKIVENTGFTPRTNGAGKFIIVRVDSEKPGSIEGQVRDESGKPVPNARVSVAGFELGVLTDRRGRFLLEDVPAGAQAVSIFAEGMQKTRVTDVVVRANHRHTLGAITIPATVAGITQLEDYIVSAKKNDGVIELDPYEVREVRAKAFGTANIDLTRTEDDALPFDVYSAEDIQRSGAINLAEFFRTRLSQNFSQVIPEENRNVSQLTLGNVNDSANQLNLANGAGGGGALGAREMVILVNGRRLPNRVLGNFDDSVPVSGNFRGIPIGSIERIEVLTSAASAIYGEGATGGVLNIVTKSDYRGGEVSLSFESPLDAHAPKKSMEFDYSAGLPYGVGLRVRYAYMEQAPLNFEDRSDVTVSRWRHAMAVRDVDQLFLSGQPPLGATANVASVAGDPLFGPGTATYTSAPVGYSGGGGLAAFSTRAGQLNLDLAEGGNTTSGGGRYATFGAALRNRSMTLALSRPFGQKVRAEIEYNRVESTLRGESSNEKSFTIVPASAPTNPFGQDVFVTWFDPRLARPELERRQTDQSDQLSATVRLDVGEWRAIVDGSAIRDRNESKSVDFTAPLGGNGSFAAALLSGAYNPFVDARTVAPASPGFYSEYEQTVERRGGETWNYQGTAKVSGPIGNLPDGPLQVTTGLEWLRQDRSAYYTYNITSNSSTGQVLRGIVEEEGKVSTFVFDTASIYGEVTAPLIGRPRRFLSGLELFGAGRYSEQTMDGFRNVGFSLVQDGPLRRQVILLEPREYGTKPFLYAFGAKVELADAAILRASRSYGFKPPTFSQVIPSTQSRLNTTVTDRRNNQQVVLTPAMKLTGGNPNLEPETTESTNVGIVLRSRALKGLRFSADFVESVRTDAITSLTPQVVLNLEANDPMIAARVQRAPNGTITLVDARSINFREIRSKMATFSVEQRLGNILGGRVVANASATKNISFSVQTSATTPAEEQIRNPEASFAGFFVEWNANAQLRWERGQWSVGWNGTYFDDVLLRSTDYSLQGSDRLESDMEHDFSVTYSTEARRSEFLSQELLSGMTVTVGMRNAFNRKPRYQAGSSGGYFSGDSIYGRSVWVNVRKEF